MIKIIEAHAVDLYRLYVKFSDGAEGEVDLSALAGQGVFAAWSDQIDLCADSLYLSLTGRTVQDLFPKLATEGMRA